MEQSEIIFEITNRFADKFKELAKVKIKDSLEDKQAEGEPIIFITLVGIEEMQIQNMTRKIQLKGLDKDGKEFEYFVKPASMFTLTYMVTPYFKTYADSLKTLGAIVKHVKDHGIIEVNDYDWIENDNNPVLITPLTGLNFEKQMQLCNMLHTEYWPSLFYQVMVGIDSGNKEQFSRVKERKFDMFKKKDE